MNLRIISFFVLLFLVCSCKTNQTFHGKKHGKWVLTDVVNNDIFKYIEKYKKDEEVRTWKTFKNKKLYKKEKYKGAICYVTFYHDNGKASLKGKTKIETNEKEAHWFYFDEWKVYDEFGKLVQLKYYEEGVLLSEIEVK